MNNEFRKFEKKQEFACSADVYLKEQVVPIDRDTRYGEPLGKVLRRTKLGDVVGAGTTLCAREEPGEKDIEYAELHLVLANLDSALKLVIDELTNRGAPVGSYIDCLDPSDKNREIPFGDTELLNVFLDNASLPLEIYESMDTATFMAGLQRAFRSGKDGKVYGPLAWNSEVLVYFAGDSADRMYSIVEKLPSEFPIFQNARVVFQRRDSSKEPKTIRLPFNQ